ncbi:MAG: hypothetical protein JO147_05215 [Actinobacteria bacterium]|nr:hypothetical protein [Actinomycetota bacterium]
MAASTPNLPRPYRVNAPAEDFHVSELAADAVGSMPPFGNIEFPVPIETLGYVHPGPADRPNLLGD